MSSPLWTEQLSCKAKDLDNGCETDDAMAAFFKARSERLVSECAKEAPDVEWLLAKVSVAFKWPWGS